MHHARTYSFAHQISDLSALCAFISFDDCPGITIKALFFCSSQNYILFSREGHLYPFDGSFLAPFKVWLNHSIGFPVPPLPTFLYPIPLVSVGQVRPRGQGAERCGQNRLGGRAPRLKQARELSASAREVDRGTKMKGGGGGPEIQYQKNPQSGQACPSRRDNTNNRGYL